MKQLVDKKKPEKNFTPTHTVSASLGRNVRSEIIKSNNNLTEEQKKNSGEFKSRSRLNDEVSLMSH